MPASSKSKNETRHVFLGNAQARTTTVSALAVQLPCAASCMYSARTKSLLQIDLMMVPRTEYKQLTTNGSPDSMFTAGTFRPILPHKPLSDPDLFT
ncbi:hypothetical protein AG1IA_07422 [Rhizoctonia solani AG-1 IA]|uniref:Uncharacterized protein n=1 Tax=Thanatephorus cucumeris (strain AG1-IA) TaxID=983506 RepID=L8WK24_THACA|nr:hypothetical protein AG1IA_07422 [Rhizoctonia solani AG-1 IA]